MPEVSVARAKATEGFVELKLPARALAGESARIYARATGFVSERRADLGDAVRKGDVLAIISAPEIDEAVREAEAVLAQAKADEELARANFARAEALVGSGAISKEKHLERKANLGVGAAARTAAEARLAAARERQAFRMVRAPFAGVVVSRDVERGDRVVGDAVSAQPMFGINALDPLRVVVDVPQNAVLRIQEGLKGEITFAELPGESFQAEVVRSARAIDAASGVMRVELRLPNPGNRIPAGMLGTVSLRLRRAVPAMVVPVSAVIQDARGARVATLKGDAVEYREVSIGRNLGDQIEVLSGIAANEQIILAPNALLTPGTQVKVRDAGASVEGRS
ncbi:efflux RND transporter periplasmic adaptor subunit [Steroidobacter cummioxidans]|uniref:efflux RND transporter periplasmic adaptor subunit n=1 Tax=Steroidobacter cummioxidans TaxID=1803913 RepID=UPI001F4EE069|nr:efflux RND transporter periplasmic adaptor subunit [Steroidobacter cummioxidans]